MAISLYNVHLFKIRWNFVWVRFLGVRFEKSNILKINSSSSRIYKPNQYNSIAIIISILTVIYLKASVFIHCNISQSYYSRKRRKILTVFFSPRQEDINSLENIRHYDNIQSTYQNFRNNWRNFRKKFEVQSIATFDKT